MMYSLLEDFLISEFRFFSDVSMRTTLIGTSSDHNTAPFTLKNWILNYLLNGLKSPILRPFLKELLMISPTNNKLKRSAIQRNIKKSTHF